MRFPILTKIMAGSFLSLMIILCLSAPGSAGRISEYDGIPYWEYTYFQSRITYVSPLKDYIVTDKRKVFLVEAEHEGETLCTGIRNVAGEEIAFESLKAGQWVYVWGGVLIDHTIGARDIVVLPGKMLRTEMANYPVLLERKRFAYQKSLY